MPAPFLLALMGPTGSGKSELAERLAERYDAALINADAFQVYRGMDIGTAKPQDRAKYRLLDLKEPNEGFGVGEFVRLAHAELEQLFASGTNAIVVGGTGLYIRALFEQYEDMADQASPELREELNRRHAEEGLDSLAQELTNRAPEVANRIDLRNPARVKRALERLAHPPSAKKYILPHYAKLKLALVPEPSVHEPRLAERVSRMVQNGWVQEVKHLLEAGFGPKDPGFRAIGYREIAGCVRGEKGLEEAMATTIAETRRYAKRQRTWLRSEPDLVFLKPESGDVLLNAEAHVNLLFV
jgi:tRNA dimethylallyltransferase